MHVQSLIRFALGNIADTSFACTDLIHFSVDIIFIDASKFFGLFRLILFRRRSSLVQCLRLW